MRYFRFVLKILSVVLTFSLVSVCQPIKSTALSPTFSMSGTEFIQGETVLFNCENVDSSYYIAILVAGYKNYANDPTGEKGGDRRATLYCSSNEISYSTSKLAPGDYAAVLFGEGWSKQKEIAFSVKSDPALPTFLLDKTRYQKGETVTISLTNTSSIHNITLLREGYTNYTMDKEGVNGGDRVESILCRNKKTLTYDTSNLYKGGRYAVVLFADGWTEIKKVYIEIDDPQNPKNFTLDKSEYENGETISFSFENTVSNDYAAIFPVPRKNYNTRYGLTYLKPKQSGFTFDSAQLPAGDYVATLFDNSGSWNVIKDIYFSVAEAKPKKSFSIIRNEIGYGKPAEFNCFNTESTDYLLICSYGTEDIYNGYTVKKFCSAGETAVNDILETGVYSAYLCDGSDDSVISETEFTVCSYINSGESITVYKTCELTLSREPHSEKNGSLFIGWKYQNGSSPPNGVILEAGTVLTAVYVDFDIGCSGDFYIGSTEIRTRGEPALRFTVCYSSALKSALADALGEAPAQTDFGTIVLPSFLLNENGYSELFMDSSYTYNGEEYNISVIPAYRFSEETETGGSYTLCITGLKGAEYYFRQYSARGYMRFTNLNGNASVAYTETVSANPYIAARTALEQNIESLDGESIAVLKSIIEEFNEYNSLEFEGEKMTVAGSPDNANTYIYRLNKSGITVREAFFESGKGGDPVKIVQITDAHINTLKADTSVKNLRALLELAAGSDRIVLSGDAVDYLTDENLTVLQREIWDRYPFADVLLGNHDIIDPDGLMTEEECFEKLQSFWKHNIFYSSSVLKEKVMLIQLNNGNGEFYECQVEPLERDIRIARENGYTVLLFVHIPLCTQNPEEESVSSLTGDVTGTDYYTNKYNTLVGAVNMPDGATKTVYNLIVNNADVIKGVFNGHSHTDFYTEIIGSDESGAPTVIPQYTVGSVKDGNGHLMKITVY